MKGREAHALLAWVPELALDALYRGGVAEPSDVVQFKLLARAARQRALSMAPLASDGDLTAPGDDLSQRIEDLTRRPVFVDCYAGYGARVVKLPLNGLVAPQWSVDIDYVDQLKGALPSPHDEEALFDFCFAEDQVGDVAVLAVGTQQVGVVNVPRGQPPRVGRMTAELGPNRRQVTFSIEVEARPHLIHVMAAQPLIQQGGMQFVSPRLVVLDGVHRLVALLSSGYTHAYALVLTELVPQQLANYMGGGGPHLLLDAALGAPRPPRLEDYLDDRLFDVISLQQLETSFNLVIAPQFQQRPTPAEQEADVPLAGVRVDTIRKAQVRKRAARG